MTTPAPDERDRIRAAMDRILAGTPERSNGALTVGTGGSVVPFTGRVPARPLD